MQVAAKLEAGARAEILIWNKWHRCRVKTVSYWQDSSGNSYPVYSVRFGDGTYMKCGNNSLRELPIRS